jgi:cephalosporin-C deacetylase-like acetyl esterase
MPVSRLTRTGALAAMFVAGALGPSVYAQAPAPGSAPDNSARQKLIETLDGIANQQLAERAEAVARIRTQADAERRKTQVRERILGLIGGLPEHRGPVAVKQFGTLTGDGFRVEKLAYESLPGLWVTANLYLPGTGNGPATGNGPFPAVLLAPGHEATGKQSQYSFGGNFARSGIIALAIDPLGQGERLQYFDPEKKASTIGGSTGEHGEANVPAMLIGEDVARYFVNDSMRGIDYLISRRDVNAERIGALGCSGGGTSTAYLAALDDRVKVAGVACYITSFKELLPSATGVQEAEQSIPHFIEQGLDFGDYVELFAPKPYAIISTTADMFPFEGAKQTHEEAARIYKLYGAEDRLQWITGPGGHGNLGPISPAILGFFLHYLKGGPAGDATFTPLRIQNAADLLCTPTGQVSTSIGGETIASIIKAHAAQTLPKTLPAAAELAEDIRGLAGVIARPSNRSPVAMVSEGEQRQGYRVDKVTLQSEDGEVLAWVAIPSAPGLKPAVLMVDSQPEKLTVAGGDFDRLAKSGKVVMALGPKPSPPGTEGLKSPYLGPFNLLSLRAFLVGKTILGMRVDDTIKAVDWLVSRGETDPNAITAYGSGAMGAVVLHTAALDSRIKKVVIENTLASYRMVLDQPLHRDISEIVIPGVLAKYDMGDLLMAVAPRPVIVLNPRDAAGLPTDFSSIAPNISIPEHAAGDPLPLD